MFNVSSALGTTTLRREWLNVLYENQNHIRNIVDFCINLLENEVDFSSAMSFWNKVPKDLSAFQVTNELSDLAIKTFSSVTASNGRKG